MELFASMSDRYVDAMGIALDTPSSKSGEFKMNYQNPAQRKEAYLDYYVHNHPLASWTKIAKLLHGCIDYPNRLLWLRTPTFKVCFSL